MKIYNSLSNKLEEFKPFNNKKVTIYVCGITPYDTTHLGHAFTYLSFDTLIRYLKFKGYQVAYTQNVTDINDRDMDILERARQENIPWKKLADYWTKRFLKDMADLNWISPDNFLKASNQLPVIIQIIKLLIKKGFAYQINGSVYLDISKFPDFGRLSKLGKQQMFKVAEEFEEDLNCPEKKNPLDITLWRSSTADQPKHIPSFPSPFGAGRPGWHIECSAMAVFSLGEQIDIHGGGKDLIFPHHEAEIAQSEGATGKTPFAKYWIHTGTVYYKGQKMSKSKKNLVMVSDLLKKYSPNAIRWLLLSNLWPQNWEFAERDLLDAEKNIMTLNTALASPRTVRYGASQDHVPEGTEQGVPRERKGEEIVKGFSGLMDQNINTKEALKFLLKNAKRNPNTAKHLLRVLGFQFVK